MQNFKNRRKIERSRIRSEHEYICIIDDTLKSVVFTYSFIYIRTTTLKSYRYKIIIV